jgi:hypothetical protein
MLAATATEPPGPPPAAEPLSPGTYLRLRRQAAGLTLEELAMAPEILGYGSLADALARLEALENDLCAPIDFDQVMALGDHFNFDPHVFVQLVAVRAGRLTPAPDVCRKCGCSWNDACGSSCAWASPTNDLCTACAPLEPVQ